MTSDAPRTIQGQGPGTVTAPAVHYSVSASGDRVTEALVDDVEQGRELVAEATTSSPYRLVTI